MSLGAGLELSAAVVLALLAAAFAAGFVDAVVGGGGLIQLPALLVALPGAAPVHILATNKLASICGTSVASATYLRRVQVRPRTIVALMTCAFAGSGAGALAASHISKDVFNPIVLAALVVVGGFVVLKPSLGEQTLLRLSGRRHTAAVVLIGVVIGAYDGVLGPGTGSFLVIGLVAVGYSFVEASAQARLANLATNAAALCVFVPQGAVIWPLGLAMGAANLAGGYVGARVAVARGASFVRLFFIVVVSAFVVRLGGQELGWW